MESGSGSEKMMSEMRVGMEVVSEVVGTAMCDRLNTERTSGPVHTYPGKTSLTPV